MLARYSLIPNVSWRQYFSQRPLAKKSLGLEESSSPKIMSLYPPHPKTNQDRATWATLRWVLDGDGENFSTCGRLSRPHGLTELSSVWKRKSESLEDCFFCVALGFSERTATGEPLTQDHLSVLFPNGFLYYGCVSTKKVVTRTMKIMYFLFLYGMLVVSETNSCFLTVRL